MISVDVLEELVPNPLTMVAQLLSTLILFLIVKKFLWQSIKNFFAVRADKMQSDLTATETALNQAEADRQAAKQQLKEAAVRSEDIVNAAVKEAKNQKETILAQADREAEAARQKARDQIAAERLAAYESMKEEMVDVALAAAGRMIGENNADEMDRQAIDAFVNEATAHGK